MADRLFGRYSVLACDPIAEIRVEQHARRGAVDALERGVAAFPRFPETENSLRHFCGGWIGFLTYEAGLGTENIASSARNASGLPALVFRLYDCAAVFDHVEQCWFSIAVDWPPEIARRRPTVGDRLHCAQRMLDRAKALELEPIQNDVGEPKLPPTMPPQSNMSPSAYFAKVRRAKRYIEAGDIYQVNLSQRFSTRIDASPLALYRCLRAINPASHSAFLPCDDCCVLSASPELFLHLRGGRVVTRPIKGTRPRTGRPMIDAALRDELIQSEKDRAELNMIVDLLRNDLGRVCAFGSVRVLDAGLLEEHPTVFHRVATIEGTLDDGRNWADLLRSAFPGGSITGAPKIRAMQIIDELEPTARGVYCGAIGWIGLDGSMTLNIAIRTMVHRADRVSVYAGGAIVADSDPLEEYEEILAKAAGMFRALGCAVPTPAGSAREMSTA